MRNYFLLYREASERINAGGNLRIDIAQTLREFMTAMPMISYDDPAYMFRKYTPEECENNGEGYPFIWNELSEVRCAERLFRCDDCGFAYLEDGDILTVHHANLNKRDCRRENLFVYCWLHHSVDHESLAYQREFRCRFCKTRTYFVSLARLTRHIRGIHRYRELRIPAITLDQRPTSFLGRGRVFAAIQEQQRLWRMWRD